MTTFEPCGFRAKTTGTLIANLDSAYEYGVRQPNGKRLTEEQWAEYVAETFEVVYREVLVGTDSENCEACSKTGNGLACEDHFYA